MKINSARHKSFLSLLFAALIILGTTNASGFSKSQTLPTKPSDPSFGFSITDSDFYNPGAFSSIVGTLPGSSNANVECLSVSDPKCAAANGSGGGKGGLQLTYILPPCTTKSDASDVCIKSLRTADGSGKLQNSSLEYEADTNKIAKDPKFDLPAGGGASVWKGTNIRGETVDYAVVVNLMEFWTSSDPTTKKPNKTVWKFEAQVAPVKIKSGDYYPIYWKKNEQTGYITAEPQAPSGAVVATDERECLIVDKGRCASPDTFFADQKIELTLQMDNVVSGWLFGRMKDTVISSTPLSKTTTLLTVEGSSINVPNGFAWIPLSAIKDSAGLQEMDSIFHFSSNTNAAVAPSISSRPSSHPDLFGFMNSPNPKVKGTGMFQAIEPWLKSVESLPTWRFTSNYLFSGALDNSTSNKVWDCTINDKSKLHGFLTTNAMAAVWAPPVLRDGFLTYKVAGSHLDVDGSVYKGTYNLSMNLDSAKCIYGFKKAPTQASISISRENGETTNIATEVVTVRNGWLNLNAYNFTFSDPTIKIQLIQPGNQGSSNSEQSRITTKSPQSKKTIICVKNSSKKVVSGITPKCPNGYKKK